MPEKEKSSTTRTSVGSFAAEVDEDSLLDEQASLVPSQPDEPLTWQSLILGYLCFVMLGIAPQLIQNALFSETAVLKSIVPEEKEISAYIVTAFMVANIFCLIYLCIQRYRPITDTFFVYIIMLGNLALCPIIIFLWKKTFFLERWGNVSWILILCSFLAGSFGNTATLVFFAFSSYYHSIFTTALSVGFGVGGAITTIMALVQDPLVKRFPVEVFFLSLGCLLLVTLFTLIIVLHTSWGRSLKRPTYDITDTGRGSTASSYSDYMSVNPPSEEVKPVSHLRASLSPLFNMFWLSMITFFVPAVIPFLSDEPRNMMYMNAIFLVAPPVGAMVTGWLKVYHLTWSSVIVSILLCVIIIPVIKTTQTFSVEFWIVCILLVCFSLVSGYGSTMVYLRIQRDWDREPRVMEKVSRWAGFANQIGATIGIVINDIIIRSNVEEMLLVAAIF
ncbi:hypothetical protein PROFUN_12735 [Planoprotostelium fungivorum]|uniref:Uncharacterized protein n=1 Tax=Planoprotostelium fungivorum TaxID=1890364 RepID=A0A2P6N8J4_9EUKA|nr:hypothetical protein PROFUN_12735 [Planoprotostelium fungivorum]